MTFKGQGHVISRSLLLILVASVRIHLCAKFDANRTVRLRVIHMVPERDGQSNRPTVHCDGADSDRTGGGTGPLQSPLFQHYIFRFVESFNSTANGNAQVMQ